MFYFSYLSCFGVILILSTCYSLNSDNGPYTSDKDSEAVFQTKPVNPIIFIPGFGGAQLHARLTNVNPPHYLCHKNTADYVLLWLGVEYLLPYAIDCLLYYLHLNYVPTTRQTEFTEGVDVQVSGWGDSCSIEWLSPIMLFPTSYFGYVVDDLVKHQGYVRNVSIRGAPYDFRRTPRENQHVIDDLKLLVERTYSSNGGMKVILVAHSNGGLYTLHMLHQQTQAWKDRYIKSYVSANVPYAGTVKSLKGILFGDDLNIPIISSVKVGRVLRSWPTSYYLLPNPTHWSANEIIVYGPTRNYTVNDYEQLFNDSGNLRGFELYKNTINLTNPMTPPGVEVHCVYSLGQKTPAVLDFRNKKFLIDEPNVEFSDGDGTVNARSLNVCLEWRAKQSQPISSFVIGGWSHLNTIRSPNFIDYIANVVSGQAN